MSDPGHTAEDGLRVELERLGRAEEAREAAEMRLKDLEATVGRWLAGAGPIRRFLLGGAATTRLARQAYRFRAALRRLRSRAGPDGERTAARRPIGGDATTEARAAASRRREAERRLGEVRERVAVAEWRVGLIGSHGDAPSVAPAEAWRPAPSAGPHPRFELVVGAPTRRAAAYGGDLYLAESLRRELERRGYVARVHMRADREASDDRDADVLVHLRGRGQLTLSSRQLNLLWHLSHPEELSEAELERYDAVLVASGRRAEELRGALAVPVYEFLQFTDPTRFRPDARVLRSHELLFVGNWRSCFRPIVWDALRAGWEPALYGRGWRWLAPEHAVADHVPNAELPGLYAGCSILLNDHWSDMREGGFVSNRVYDALACGTFVVSDHVDGMVESLADGLVTYRDRDHLSEILRHHLADPDERRRVAQRGRAAVLDRHCVAHRVDALLETAREVGGQTDRPEVRDLAFP